jgi:hypothetical protein
MVQSTPLFDLSGRALGVFSTHYRTAASMRARESAVLDSLARAARAALHAYGRRPAADPNSVSGFDVEVCELQARAHLLRARIEKLDDELNRIRRGLPARASIRTAN